MSREPIVHRLADDGRFPNNVLPALLYPGAVRLTGDDPASLFETTFAHNGWTGSWRNGLYSVHHYHSTAHEVLGVYSGSARVLLGGERGQVVTIAAGDVLVVPAGVAHKNIGQSRDLRLVGAYPGGTAPDMQYGKAGERPETDRNIAKVSLPAADPVSGRGGPLVSVWRAPKAG